MRQIGKKMDYLKAHNVIIENAKNRKIPNGYVEVHHIIPKSMGGSNNKTNLVTLTGKEHFLIHWLLYKIYKNQAMAFAWSRMTSVKKNNKRYTSKSFEYAKMAKSKFMSILSKTRVVTEETKEKCRKAKLGKSYSDMGRSETPLRNRPISDEHKEKISKGNKGNTYTEEQIKRFSESKKGELNPMYGKKTSKEVADKIRQSMIGVNLGKKRTDEAIRKQRETRKRNKEIINKLLESKLNTNY
jgi:hypothetical protein